MKKILAALLLGSSMLLTVSAQADWNQRSYCRAYPRAPECRRGQWRNGQQWRGGQAYCLRVPFVSICGGNGRHGLWNVSELQAFQQEDAQQFDQAEVQ